jgi:hypothetical protein
VLLGGRLLPQIEELRKSIRDLKRTRVQKEKMFEREKQEFRKELDARLKEIEVLKRNSERARQKLAVRGPPWPPVARPPPWASTPHTHPPNLLPLPPPPHPNRRRSCSALLPC